jgi:hypothetical protein
MYSVLLGSYGSNQSKIEIRQDPATQDIKGYRYLNNQMEPSCYPLKKINVERIKEDPSLIISLHRDGFEPTINAKGKIEWVIDRIATYIRDRSATVDRYSNDSNSNLLSSASSSSPIDRGSSSSVNDSQTSVNPPLPTTQEADPQLSIRPLLPLAENPLRETHPLGFPLGASRRDYSEKYPEWCENVLSRPRIRGSSYEKAIKKCEQMAGLENQRCELEQMKKGWKNAIDRAIKIILEFNEVNLLDLNQIYSQFKTIYGNVYQFIFIQIQNVEKLKNDKHAFLSCFQRDFYDELKDVFLEMDQAPFNNIRLDIFESQIQTDDEASSSEIKKLQDEYPDSAGKIEELARLAQGFVQRKRNELTHKVNDYLCWPEVSSCWQLIFKRCPDLKEKYHQMKRMRFSSLVDIGRGYQADCYKDPYITLFSKIVAACERFAASPQKGTDQLNQLKQEIGEIYVLLNNKLDHFDRRIEPLVFLRDVIQIILKWPGEYELSQGEKLYISNAVYFLISISNKSLTAEPEIPYNYQNIPEKEKSDAVRVLASKKTTAQKREACRMLLYSRIPWKALIAIGSLFHGGGGIKPEQIAYNRRLLGEALIDLFDEFRIIEAAMTDLIEFELSEFTDSPSLQPPTDLPEDCFRYIHLLGDRQQILNSLNEICGILQWWETTPLDASQVNEIRVKYAVLRTIQMVGELSKTLRQAGLLNVNESASRCIEQLRDLLAHLEKFKVNKRLQALLKMDNLPGCQIVAIIEDFKELLHYFMRERIEVSKAREWLEIKNLQNVDQDLPQLEVNNLRTLVVYLDSQISLEEQTALRMTVMGEEARNKRREIYQIKEEFLAGCYERLACEEKIAELSSEEATKALFTQSFSLERSACEEELAERSCSEEDKKTLLSQFLSRKRASLEQEIAELSSEEVKKRLLINVLSQLRTSCKKKIEKLPLSKKKKELLYSLMLIQLDPRHYYRRGVHFRSGATDPRMLNVIKKYADNKKTPDDEKALFRKLREKLLEGRLSAEGDSSSEEASPRIHDAQEQFSAIIALRKERGTCNPELENVESRFIELTETLDAFSQRKKREIEPILHSFDVYEDDSDIDHEVTRLIERMEVNSINPDELSLAILALGVDGDVSWQNTFDQYRLRLAKGAAPTAKGAVKDTLQFDLAKIKWSMTSILGILDQLHGLLPEDRDVYHHDKTLQLACQFLYSSFRGRAITLEYGIEFLKSTLPDHRHQLNAIQETLNRVIDQANGVLHVHGAAEVSTLTPFGQAFVEGLFLDQLAKDASIGKDRQLTINSLRTQLRALLEVIESRESSSVVSSST